VFTQQLGKVQSTEILVQNRGKEKLKTKQFQAAALNGIIKNANPWQFIPVRCTFKNLLDCIILQVSRCSAPSRSKVKAE
jgi:hypothetical protein